MLEAVPPVALVPYQFNVAPVDAVAVKAIAVAFTQYDTGVVDTVGAAGVGFIVTTIGTGALTHDPIVCEIGRAHV